MKISEAAQYLLAENEDFKFAACTFQGASVRYTYKTLLDVEVGDFVLVDTASGVQIVVVRDVLQIEDVDAGAYEYKWIIGKVDWTHMKECEAMEEAVLKKLRAAQRKHIANQALTTMLTDEDADEVKKLVRL